MSVYIRSFGAISLCLLLVLTSQSMAVVRGASAATGQMVLCVGATTQTVYTDAQGQPTTAPHFCPDCVIAFYAQDIAHKGLAISNGYRDARACPYAGPRAMQPVAQGFHARGPPWMV